MSLVPDVVGTLVVTYALLWFSCVKVAKLLSDDAQIRPAASTIMRLGVPREIVLIFVELASVKVVADAAPAISYRFPVAVS